MTRKPMTLICVQPCIKYYAWQIEVMLTNFERLGIQNEFHVHCLFAYNTNEPDYKEKISIIQKLEGRFNNIASFFYYQDTRVYPISYISSIRPNVLKQHFKVKPELSEDVIFYHDCDIVFTKFPDFLNNYLQKDANWYVSDTISYIGHNYIISKGQDVLDEMCEIVGINKKMVEERENQSGGAQYILKGVDWMFFEKMEKDCEKLFKDINILNAKKKQEDPTHHELQIWCADMWALLWNGWMRGYTTNVIPEMDFCWATDSISRWDEKIIFHNAGVVDNKELFLKSDYTKILPYEIDGETYNQNRASYKYFEIIKSIGKNSCLYDREN